MTLAELRAEVQARGFDHVSPTTRIDAWINRIYFEICEEEDWPFLEATSSGNAPLSVSDLRTIESVIDTTSQSKLQPLDRRGITDFDYTLETTGTPGFYYTTDLTTINVYPANTTDTISVRYWRVPDTLTNDGDSPEIPARFHQLLVDGACAYAYRDTDNFEAARALLDDLESGKDRMRNALLNQQHDSPDDFIVSRVDHQDA